VSGDLLLESLRAAVQAAPDDVILRLHLARMLVEAGETGEAIQHAAVILQADPGHQGAVELIAGRAALSPTAAGRTMDASRANETSGPAPTAEPACEPAGEPFTDPACSPAAAAISDDEVLRLLDSEFTGVVPPMYVESSRYPGSESDEPDDDQDDDELSEIFDAFTPEPCDLTLADVAGMEEVKARLEAAVLAPIRNPELVKLYAKSLRGGLLLYGPPGCGKTFIARALAGEIGARLLSVSLADVLDMYIGQSERNLRAIFEIARHSAPCVIFLDEIDALGQKRTQLRSSASRGTVNQLLTEMDGLAADNEGVYVLGATNHPWDVDVALRRPGRFDRMLLVLPPDEKAREAVLRYSLRDRPIAAVDTRALARMTDGYSGADLAFVCESAAERALLDSVRSGRPRMIEMGDLEAAVKDSRSSIGPWLQTARNVAEFANADGSYDDLLTYLRSRKLA
jgi:AAA+ superfamily predicted ATPase